MVVTLTLMLASGATNVHAEERSAPLDPRPLFAPGGVLSPGYQAAHPRSTAAPLELHERDESVPRVALLANPALGAFGKWSARLEVAPLRAHALFVEVSRLHFDGGDVQVSGVEVDVGYHLFPFDRGLSGLYLGPRYVYASGDADLARGTIHGFGGDIGFQWVVGIVCINLGAGAAYTKITIDPKSELLTSPDVSPDVKGQIPDHAEQKQVFPLVTAGLGLAF